MQAGKLAHRIKLQESLAAQDTTGQPAPAVWTDVATVWADVRFVNGLEAIKSDAAVAIARCSIRIRYRAGVSAAMRFLEGATVYNIRAVLPDPTARRWLDCVCETGASDG